MTDQILFDKLAYIDRLKTAGVPEGTARAHADAMHEALRESVATKSDIGALRAEITRLELTLTTRVGVMIAAAVAILASIKFFG